MKKRIALSILALTIVVGVLTVVVVAQGGFDTWISLNRTGMSDSRYVVNRAGVGDSQFIVATSALVLNPPGNLVLTMVGDNEVLITWTMGVGACNVTVRGAIGRLPLDRTDGYLVYYGSGTSATDVIDSDNEVVFYRVWSQGCDSSWETTGIYDSIGGLAWPLIALAILAAGLTITMFMTRNSLLGFPAGIFWGILSGFAYTQSSSTWDWQYILFFGAMGMVIFSIFAAYTLRKRDLAGPDADSGKFIDEEGGERDDEELDEW